ncbi:MAG: prenyltransferase [Acidimicrobiales bacterium]
MTGLSRRQVADTTAWIASQQLANGMIPWWAGGHADPWNHVEAAMALLAGGRREEADAALAWLVTRQHDDGSWCYLYLAEGVEEPRRDPNACAYVATGAWWHYLVTGDQAALAGMWPVVERAVDFAVRLQRPGGQFSWSLGPDGTPGRYALLSASSSIHHSLRCALAAARHLGRHHPGWELAAGRVAHAVARRPDRFQRKDSFAMDWYYPVLCGAVSGQAARHRLLAGRERFVMEGLGVRCVSSHPWVTAAETAECAMAHDAAGMAAEALALWRWAAHLRDGDGAYWTGCVHPGGDHFPAGERSTYSAAAMVIADHVLGDRSPASGLFRTDGLPAVPEVAAEVVDGASEG